MNRRDRRLFLETLGANCGKTGWRSAYCLMSDYFHLVMETPRERIVQIEKYTISYPVYLRRLRAVEQAAWKRTSGD
jgi:hypothetical protein